MKNSSLHFVLRNRVKFAKLSRIIVCLLADSVPAGFRSLSREESVRMASNVKAFTNLLNDLMLDSPFFADMPDDILGS